MIRLEKHIGKYPEMRIKCPQCDQTMWFYSISPKQCKMCNAPLDNITKMAEKLEGREEYYRSGICLFLYGDHRQMV